jgi:type IV pilus assembly protein PilX
MKLLRDQRGAVLVIAIVMLLILSVIGIYAMGSSIIEVKISGQKKFYDAAFNDADGGVQFVRASNQFGTMASGSADITYSAPSNTGFNFTATLSYLGNSPPPVGTGTGQRAGFKAHYHRIQSTGRDTPFAISNSSVALEVEGYRIGF